MTVGEKQIKVVEIKLEREKKQIKFPLRSCGEAKLKIKWIIFAEYSVSL